MMEWSGFWKAISQFALRLFARWGQKFLDRRSELNALQKAIDAALIRFEDETTVLHSVHLQSKFIRSIFAEFRSFLTANKNPNVKAVCNYLEIEVGLSPEEIEHDVMRLFDLVFDEMKANPELRNVVNSRLIEGIDKRLNQSFGKRQMQDVSQSEQRAINDRYASQLDNLVLRKIFQGPNASEELSATIAMFDSDLAHIETELKCRYLEYAARWECDDVSTHDEVAKLKERIQKLAPKYNTGRIDAALAVAKGVYVVKSDRTHSLKN